MSCKVETLPSWFSLALFHRFIILYQQIQLTMCSINTHVQEQPLDRFFPVPAISTCVNKVSVNKARAKIFLTSYKFDQQKYFPCMCSSRWHSKLHFHCNQQKKMGGRFCRNKNEKKTQICKCSISCLAGQASHGDISSASVFLV